MASYLLVGGIRGMGPLDSHDRNSFFYRLFLLQKHPYNTATTLPETNGSPLQMDGWNTIFLLGPGLFSAAKNGEVSGSVFLVVEVLKVPSSSCFFP